MKHIFFKPIKLRKFFCTLFLCLLCINIFLPKISLAASKEEVDNLISTIPTDIWPQAPDIASEAGILIEPESGTILYAKNATEALYPASTTKLMTALLTLENCSLEEVVTYSSTAVLSLEPGSSHIGLKVGEQLTVKDSLYGLLLPSANEVANGLAEHVSGSISAFADKMNEKAASLGAVNTHFANANGLHDDNHYTCAYDLALIMQACIQNPTFLEIDSTPTYVRKADSLLNKEIPMGSTHKMMRENTEYYDPNVICGKTGWTQQAGRCLVTYAQKDGLSLICVVMKSEDPQQYQDTKALLDYGFNNFKEMRASENDPDFEQGQVSSSSPLKLPQESISLSTLSSDSFVVMPNNISFDQLDKTISETENGQSTITYSLEGYTLGSAALIPSTQTVANNMFSNDTNHSDVFDSPVNHLFVLNVWVVLSIVLLIIAAIIGLIVLIQYRKEQKEKERKKEDRPRYRY